MNPKIKASALKELQGKRPDDLVTLKLRTNTVLGDDEFEKLRAWGGELFYDNGMLAIVSFPAGRVNEVAEWEKVLEII